MDCRSVDWHRSCGYDCTQQEKKKAEAEAQRVAELKRQQSQPKQGFWERCYNAIGDYARTANETYEQEYKWLKNKTDKELFDICRSGDLSAKGLGRAKAAKQILEDERGYYYEDGQWKR